MGVHGPVLGVRAAMCPGLWEKTWELGGFRAKVALSAQCFKHISSAVTLQMLAEHSCSSGLICVTQGIELAGD